ncbi:carboxynorspermidine decarboxylase [Roseburia sp. 499]|uniref:carboxynorspermidine decarboxylase n=1 Tax=Roseburia sp. 499 TaxID=1261634 RepID=UPI000952A40B|nr:carboxynorspermidine decarboxylase [Roseburia sp. 499]WVK70697.1 carboxynorspermidine decarboxylase [Roseburia sp. 499]
MKYQELPTPCYVVEEEKIVKNIKILQDVMEQTGAHILLAQKAFSMYYSYPLLGTVLSGTTASGLYEARLGAEEMGKENHVFSAAYREDEFEEIAELCDHIVFNSIGQLRKFENIAKAKGKSIGIRINPECSTQEGHAIYDPCAPGSRLGITLSQLQEAERVYGQGLLANVEGLHFHTLCEQNSDDLKTTLDAVEEKFGSYLKKMKWLNMGGGHHITRADYDVDLLISCIRHMQEAYGVEVYLEPGEAVALNAGLLITKVLDITENSGVQNAILDTSAACHMPDVLEMPYRPPLQESGEPGEKAYTYRLGGPTCLAGDVIGEYSFDKKLTIGQTLVFEDMAIYSMVKNNTFNGMKLPAIVWKSGEDCRIVKEFGYEDFKGRI